MSKLSKLISAITFASLVCLSCQTKPILKLEVERPYSQILFLSKDKGKGCYRIPAIIQANNNDLLVAIDERNDNCGDLRHNGNINIQLRRSSDNGKSWSTTQTIIDFPDGKSASDPSFILDQKTGHLFLFYNYMDVVNEKNIYYLHYVESKDHGFTWSEPRDITTDITDSSWKSDFKFITSGHGVQSEHGILLHTLVHLKKGAIVFGSEDHGHTWKRFGTPASPGDESKIVTLEDGTWMINSRINGGPGRYIHLSKDQGNTWQSKMDSSLVDPGCNATIVRGYKNELYFINANHPKHRKNLSIRKSNDGGKSWSSASSIFPGDAAYASAIMMNNGKIAIIYERNGYKEIAFSVIN